MKDKPVVTVVAADLLEQSLAESLAGDRARGADDQVALACNYSVAELSAAMPI